MSLQVKQERWIVDSGASRHMSGNPNLFLDIQKHDGGSVHFGNKESGQIIGLGTMGNSKKKITKVALVKGLKFNLISVSQISNSGCLTCFDNSSVQTIDRKSKMVLLNGYRENGIYLIDFNDEQVVDKCLTASLNDVEMWHKRLAHVNFFTMNKLV